MATNRSTDQPGTAGHPPLVFKTGGMVMLVGVFFLLLGLAMTAGLVAIAILSVGEAPSWLGVFLVVCAAIPLGAVVLGFLLTFGGERITLDAPARQIRIAYGRWWTWKREIRSLEEFDAVEVHRQNTRVGADEHDGGQPTYPVRLLSGGDEVELANIGSYRKARALAENAANYLGLPLHEATEQETVVRAAGTLDESLAQRAERLGESVDWPKLPTGTRIRIHHEGDTTFLDLPRPNRKMIAEGVFSLGFLLLIYGGFLVGAGYFLKGWLEQFGVNTAGSIWPLIIWAVPFIPIAYILVFGVVLLISRERVAISPRVFKRIWVLPIGAWTRRIPAGEIEELLSDGDDVILRTDRTTCRVGFTLDKRERGWLRDAIRYLLVNGPPQPPE